MYCKPCKDSQDGCLQERWIYSVVGWVGCQQLCIAQCRSVFFFPHCLCTTCRPYPNSKNFHFVNKLTKYKCKTYLVKMSFICTRIKYHFHISDLALTFPLKQWFGATQKWPIYCRLRSVLKSPWILGEVLKKSLNFHASPWNVLEFSSPLNVVAWKVLFDAFWLSKTGCESSISCSRFYICYMHVVTWKLSLEGMLSLNRLSFDRNGIFNTIHPYWQFGSISFLLCGKTKRKLWSINQWITKVKASFKNTLSN